MLKHYLWDFDGTLFDSYPALTEAFRRALAAYGVTASTDEIFREMIISIPYAWSMYQSRYDLPDSFMPRFRELQKQLEPGMLVPMPGAMEICEKIVQKGGKNYLYTHRDGMAVTFMKSCGMDRLFTGFVTSEDQFPPKPAPDAVLHILKTYGIDPKEAVMIGDRPIDVQAGKNAGIYGCFFDSGHTGTDGGADWIIESLEELETLG